MGCSQSLRCFIRGLILFAAIVLSACEVSENSASSKAAADSKKESLDDLALCPSRTCPNAIIAPAANPCTFNGQSVASGNAITAYQNATVPYDQNCVSQSRSCTNATLSGNYSYASCTVLAGPAVAANAVYIDPSAVSSGGGSVSSPFNAWSKVAWRDGATYVQKSGTVARETITIGAHNITLGSYGTGPKPVIAGSNVFGDPRSWSQIAANRWALAGLSKDPVVFSHNGILGRRLTTVAALSTQWDYAYNAATRSLEVYSSVNPATLTPNLEVAVRDQIVNFHHHANVRFDNLEFRHTSGAIAWGGWGARDARFTNMHFRQLAAYALQFQQGSSGTVESSSFIDWGIRGGQDYAIQLIGTAASPSGPVDVNGNSFVVNHASNRLELTALMCDQHGWLRAFTNNIVDGTNGYLSSVGVAVWRPSANTSSITIKGNSFKKVGDMGILLQELNYYGARPTVLVENNNIELAAVADRLDVEALRVWGHNSASDVTIANNTINGTFDGAYDHHGIRIREADGTKIYNNTVSRADNGISIERGSLHIELKGNTLQNNRQSGIYISPDSSADLR